MVFGWPARPQQAGQQHSTAQHSTAQHSTAQHSTLVTIMRAALPHSDRLIVAEQGESACCSMATHHIRPCLQSSDDSVFKWGESIAKKTLEMLLVLC